ncbi:extracellular solute-binding protein [Bombella sp. ESL0378]|nr:extracellular solute-binding protein [Bombella sp. ESL0378]
MVFTIIMRVMFSSQLWCFFASFLKPTPLWRRTTTIAYIFTIVLLSASSWAASSLPSAAPSYWAIPEQSLTAMITQKTEQTLPYFLERDSYALDDIKKLTLSYPQRMQAILLDSTTSAIICARGWAQPLQATGECGQPAGYFRDVIFWDPSRLTTPPHWADLWDVARYPGQRIFFQGPRPLLEIALLADSVPPSHLYQVLATPQGADRAFHKLDQLRPYIIWWRSTSQAHHILAQHSVLMGVAPCTIVLSSQSQHGTAPPYRVQMKTILYSPAMWDIPITLPYQKSNETKQKLLTDPPRTAELPASLPPESLEISDSFWASHALSLGERFNRWLAHSPPIP